MKHVKIINFKANKLGTFNAIELDFEKFKQGVIAIKGSAGAGKSTIQKGIRLSTQGRDVLADPDQYGDEWEAETQLIDGDRKVFIGAVKKPGESVSYKLYEKDLEGKKVMTPIIDGVKATPAKYMDTLTTELTFGIKDFLDENNTVHKKFMFKLFRPELEKLGVIFDKKANGYEGSILGQLDKLTEKRDQLRALCTHKGAFMSDFERDGHTLAWLEDLTLSDLETLEKEKTNLLIEQGKEEGNGNAAYQEAKSKAEARGRDVLEKIRGLKATLIEDYEAQLKKHQDSKKIIDEESDLVISIVGKLKLSKSIPEGVSSDILKLMYSNFNPWIEKNETKEPEKPKCPYIVNGKLEWPINSSDYPLFKKLIKEHLSIREGYQSIKPEDFKTNKNYESELSELDRKIVSAKQNNDLVERFNINREWVEADAKVKDKRNELAKLYAQVNTGVKGLYMKPFFGEEGKMDIKTVYTGDYDKKFFNNQEGEERLLVSYSSTQKPIIGVLLQVARLKKKSKVLPYIFFDDVPMDKASYALISKIAEENGLTILTSITGDFSKEKLLDNEMLIEGGEVFFN